MERIKRMYFQTFILMAIIVLTVPAVGFAGETSRGASSDSEWSTSVSGGYEHQFDTDIDDSGSFSVDRMLLRAGVTYAPDRRRRFSVSLGYARGEYDFSGDRGFSGLRPWDDVNSYRMGLPVRWGFDRDWTLFVIPSVRFSAERGAELEDAMTGGGFAGVSFRFSDRLTIGPGIGVMSELEEDTNFFPALIVRWKITDRIVLETGPGPGGTSSPGISLNWSPADKWDLSIGAGYEKLRFRLDDKDVAPEGIGQDRSFTLFCLAQYQVNDRLKVGFLGGTALGGELRLEDEDGHRIAEKDYETALVGGITVRLRY